ncbi:MAG: UMP kinase [Clostridiales bacterium]|nr:UMP kinase [Clostridiales bacterium]
MQKAVYKRVIIKLSGEALAGQKGNGIDEKILSDITDQIKAVKDLGVEIGIVVGGGNFWRGRQGKEMDSSTADHMGMLATVINALAIQDALERKGVQTRVQTAIDIIKVAEPYILRKALSHLNKGRVVIFACGTGNPHFTTDTAASLRAADINAEVLLLAKNVDGIYDADPKTNPNAKKLKQVTYKEYIANELHAMDTTAITLCMENNIKVLAFGLFEDNALMRAVCGEKIGTLIKH